MVIKTGVKSRMTHERWTPEELYGLLLVPPNLPLFQTPLAQRKDVAVAGCVDYPWILEIWYLID
jgi:hypothetical protein